MNGRVYDPVLGRFLSADPNIDGAEDAQGYNRYSYVGNNPMNATDPSGYFKLKEILPAVIAIVVTVMTYGAASAWATAYLYANTTMFMSTAITAGSMIGGAIAGAAAGFASGFAGSLLNGGSIGDAFKAGAIGSAIGAVSGALSAGIGAQFGAVGGDFGNEFGRALAHGTVGGGIAEATGGEFRHGFYAGFAGSAAGSLAPRLGLPGYDKSNGRAVAARTIFAATVGGTASAIGGGKFVNGAATAAFQHLLNAEGIHKSRPFPRGIESQGDEIDDAWQVKIETRAFAFGRASHSYVAVENQLTGERYTISGLRFSVEGKDRLVIHYNNSKDYYNKPELSNFTVTRPPSGVSPLEYANRVIHNAIQIGTTNRLNTHYWLFGGRMSWWNDGGNCHNVTRSIISRSGGAFDSQFNPAGANPGLRY